MAATMAAKQVKADVAAAEKAAADATVPAAATLEAAAEPRSTFPPGVLLSADTRREAVLPGDLPPPPGILANPPGVSSSDQLPRLLSGTEERRLQDYYDLQTGIAFDLMSVNFADLEQLPGEFWQLSPVLFALCVSLCLSLSL